MVMRGLIIKHMWFDHNFAKAFWEDKELEFKVRGGIVVTGCSDKCTANVDFKGAVIPCCAWQYHLQQMVLKEEPIKYLEQFL